MRSALLPLVAALALVLAGCTGGDAPTASGAAGAPSPQQAVTTAANALADAGSARVSVTLDAPTGPVTATGPARFTPFGADLAVVLGHRDAEVRVVDDAAWLRFGAARRWQQLPSGLVPLGAVTGALHAASGLRDVTAEPGTEDVGGVPAVRHTGTVDLAAARAGATDPAIGTRLAELEHLVSPTPRFSAWLGAEGTPRAGQLVQLRLEPGAQGGGSTEPNSPAPGPITVAFSEPGLPVEVTPPA